LLLPPCCRGRPAAAAAAAARLGPRPAPVAARGRRRRSRTREKLEGVLESMRKQEVDLKVVYPRLELQLSAVRWHPMDVMFLQRQRARHRHRRRCAVAGRVHGSAAVLLPTPARPGVHCCGGRSRTAAGCPPALTAAAAPHAVATVTLRAGAVASGRRRLSPSEVAAAPATASERMTPAPFTGTAGVLRQ